MREVKLSTSFSRSLQSLQKGANADRRYPFTIVLISLLISWIIWFFFAPLTVHESSSDLMMTSSSTAVAILPIHTFSKITSGQFAYVNLTPFPAHLHGNIQATVASVDIDLRNDELQVTLLLQQVPMTINPRRGFTGSVEIEVDRSTPAQLLFSTIQQNLSR